MKRILTSCIIILFLLLMGGHTSLIFAGQVSLEISTTTGSTNESITTRFRITNRGTEPASQVSVLGQFQNEQRSVFVADRINPGQSAESRTNFKLPGNLNGTFPLYITVSYQHANGISASSASLVTVATGSRGEKKLAMKASLDDRPGEGKISILLETTDPDVTSVTVTAHSPQDLVIEPPFQKINLQQGKGLAKFTVTNVSGNEGSTYGIFFAAEYEEQGLHNLATAEVIVPVTNALAPVSLEVETLKIWLYAATLILTAILSIIFIVSSRTRHWLIRIESVSLLLDIFVLVAVEIFIFSQFDLTSLFTATTTTGGDTASHFYTLEYLRQTLLPVGKITGWTMGNYAGFPILQFYFPLPFLIMSLLDLVMPLQVAFKLVTLSGTALLPVAAYTMLRLIRCPFPGPGIGAALMLPFLFNSANSMWGGNILSTLAGEFSYSLSMSLSLILIGSLYRGAVEDNGIIRNAILVFLVGFSHGYTLLFAEAISLFLLITPYGFSRRLLYLFKVYALGFCLLAFWLVPLLIYTKYTTSYHLVWTIHSIKQVVPEILLPIVATGIAGSIVLLVLGLLRHKNTGKEALAALGYLWFGLAAAVVFFVAAPRLGVVDIRYVPYGQLMTCLMAALFLGWTARFLLNRWGLNWLLLIIIAASTLYWTDARVGTVEGWSKWNYLGFEAKTTWPVFERINKSLAGNFQDPRVVFEHSEEHNIFGSSRAFESLPLFAGRATLEGLYMQASITAPFVFYIQSMVSRASSQPFPQYNYTTMDFDRARSYLELFNVRDLIIRSKQAKQSIRQVPEYRMTKSIGQYELWQLTSNRNRYVQPLQYEPVVYKGTTPWKQIAHQWFTRDELRDTSLIFNETTAAGQNSPFKLEANSLEGLPKQEIDISDCSLKETINNEEILLETDCLGKPHLIKVSYHPNWHVEGAEKIYLASPSFMLIYPNKKQVRLFYGPGPWDRFGQLLSAFGLILLLVNVPLPGKERGTAWCMLSKRLTLPAFHGLQFPVDPSSQARKIIMLSILLGASALVTVASYRVYTNEPHRAYNRSIQHKDAKEYEKARKGFRNFVHKYPLTKRAQESSYYIAITYYLEKKDKEAIKAFEEYIKNYPQGGRVAESHYHIGLAYLRSGQTEKGVGIMKLLIENYPQTPWARYANERLQEKGYSPADEKIKINSSNLHQYMGRAITYFNQDRLTDAKPILLQVSERFPEFEGAPQALAALALCYYKEGDCLKTIKYYKKLIERYPDHKLLAEAYFHIGICHKRNGSSNLAEDAFQKVLAIDRDGIYGKQVHKLDR
ncbi:6-pyruvoyl-tetrahydropterin synthase-related protein [Thermodesulfobacteriota bacterium]